MGVIQQIILSSCVIAVCACHPGFQQTGRLNKVSDILWDKYKLKYSKQYDDKEEWMRRQTWLDNLRYINDHNLQFSQGKHTYKLGLNQYADWTDAEYRKYLCGLLGQDQLSLNDSTIWRGNNHNHGNPPHDIDWRQYGYVTPVKNQGQCGSCWAFSSTGSLEGQHYRLTGRLVSLSEQNLVDCTQNYGNAGCNGGWMMNAFKYVQSNQGVDTEGSYPYEARDDSCRYDTSDKGATDNGYVMINKGDENDLKAATAYVGPISVAIDASHRSFQLYESGVYMERNCSSTQTDHAVLVVGYGVENGTDYWLVKNSWGTSWGLDGYIKMARNQGNQCGIASFACFPKM